MARTFMGPDAEDLRSAIVKASELPDGPYYQPLSNWGFANLTGQDSSIEALIRQAFEAEGRQVDPDHLNNIRETAYGNLTLVDLFGDDAVLRSELHSGLVAWKSILPSDDVNVAGLSAKALKESGQITQKELNSLQRSAGWSKSDYQEPLGVIILMGNELHEKDGEAYHFLTADKVAVHPAYKNNGVGKDLLRLMTEMTDGKGSKPPIALMTTSETAHAGLYSKTSQMVESVDGKYVHGWNFPNSETFKAVAPYVANKTPTVTPYQPPVFQAAQ